MAAKYVVVRKSTLQVGVEEGIKPTPPDERKNWELVAVAFAGNEFFFYWKYNKSRFSWIKRFTGGSSPEG